MNFLEVQQTIRDAIAGSATFAVESAITVIKDLGDSKDAIEESLLSNGYTVTVWPPVTGSASQEEGAHQGVEVTSVVRLEVNPQKLKTVRAASGSDDGYVNDFVSAIITAVLDIGEDPTGIKFQLAPDAFELMTFDEGVIAYHIRFKRMAVFGQ